MPEPRIEKARVFVYSKRKHKNLSKRSESLIFPLGIILPSCNLIICYYLRFFSSTSFLADIRFANWQIIFLFIIFVFDFLIISWILEMGIFFFGFSGFVIMGIWFCHFFKIRRFKYKDLCVIGYLTTWVLSSLLLWFGTSVLCSTLLLFFTFSMKI